MKNIDEMMKAALQTDVETSKELNRRLVQDMTSKAEKTMKESTYSRRGFAKAAVAALCGIAILCSTSMAYAKVKGIDIGNLFAKVWTGETEQALDSRHDDSSAANAEKKPDNKSLAALEEICSDVSNIKETSTFQDIQIEPVMAVSDRFSMYVVLKVEGERRLISENNTGFPVHRFKEGGEEIVSTYSDYLLSAEGNTMYYAMKFTFREEMKRKSGQYFLKILDLYYVDRVDENGLMDYQQGSDGAGIIAAKGQYEVTFSCPVSDKKITTEIENGIEVTVTTLNAYFDADIFESKVRKNGTRIKEAFLLMEDGSKVEIIPTDGAVGRYVLCELERPVDTEKIAGLEFHGKEYAIK